MARKKRDLIAERAGQAGHRSKAPPCERHGLAKATRWGLLGFAFLALGACSQRTEREIATNILFGGQKLPEITELPREYTCPSATILDGTAVYRVGEAEAARGVNYQAVVNDLARECKLEGNSLRIKVGVQGRLILGDAGKPGQFTIPVRIAVRRAGETIFSKLVPTAVTVSPEQLQSSFVVIDDSILLTLSAEDPGDEFKVLVGIDPQGQPAARRKRR